MIVEIFVVALAALAASQVYDISETEKGIVAGVGVESNSTITMFFGTKPTATQLYIHNTVLGGIMVAVAAIGVATGNVVLVGLGIGPMIAYAGLHLKGALDWRKLLAAKPPAKK
jgi:hypothetical protein